MFRHPHYLDLPWHIHWHRYHGASSSSVVADRSAHAAGHVPDRRGRHTGNPVREQG